MRAITKLALGSLALATACGPGASSPDDAGTDRAPDAPPPLECTAPATPSRLVVTADWISRSLTLLGLERVLDPGCTADDAIVGTVDLAAYAPGPIELEITPDGRTAVVAVGPGFFEGAGGGLVGNPDVSGAGALLIVDLASRAVLGEVATTHVPMGIAIAPDGSLAYVAEYGTNAAPGTEMAIVDLAARALVSEVEIGSRPEQVVLDATGTLGAITIDDGTRVFRTADPAGSLSPTIVTGRDPSDLEFVPGASVLVVTNSMAASVSLIDVTDPAAPTVGASPRTPGVPYPVTWIPGTEDVLVGTSLRETLLRVRTADPDATPERIPLSGGALVLQVVVTADGAHAIVPHPISHALAVVDLATHAEHTLRWLDEAGPIYVALQP